MYEVGVRGPLRAAHFLRGDFGDETRLHEHRYLLDWECTADGLDANGFAVDIALMEKLLGQVSAELDGKTLNDLPFFAGRQASVEHLAQYLNDRLVAGLCRGGAPASKIRQSRMRVWESQTAWAAHLLAPGA